MNCHYCNEVVTKDYRDTEGNPICRKCHSYYRNCSRCGELWYMDRLIRGICEDCWNSGKYDEEVK